MSEQGGEGTQAASAETGGPPPDGRTEPEDTTTEADAPSRAEGAMASDFARDEEPVVPGAVTSAGQQLSTSGPVQWADLAVSGPHVFVTWVEHLPEDPVVLFRRSTDEGATFTPVQRLSGPGQQAWSSERARTVEPPSAPRVLPAEGDESVYAQRLVLQGERLHVVWGNCPSMRQRCTVSVRTQHGEGQPFGPIQVLSQQAGYPGTLDVGADGDALHLVWLEGPLSAYDLVYRRSLDAGDSFLPAQRLTATHGERLFPGLAASGGSISLTWQSGPSFYFRKAGALGTSFGEVELMSTGLWVSGRKLAATAHHGHALWMEGEPGARVLRYWRR